MAKKPPRTIRSKRKHNTKQSCNGKIRFRDKREAEHALQRIASDDSRQKRPTRCYDCPECRGVHLTSMPER